MLTATLTTTLICSLALLAPPLDKTTESVEDARVPYPGGVTRNIQYVERPDTERRRLRLDIHQPREPAPADASRPILIFIHGGGWAIGDKRLVQLKPGWANDQGWVFVSINYRFSPDVVHPEHARDAAAAIAWVRDNADLMGGDPDRIAIMGHSAGAHLAAINAADESLLDEVGMNPDQLAGVVLLDGAAYDIPSRMNDDNLGPVVRRMYERAFTLDPELWVEASPILQIDSDDTLPPLLSVAAELRDVGEEISIAITKAWSEQGATARHFLALGKDHGAVNKQLGTTDDEMTETVTEFLRTVFGQTPARPTPED